MSDQNYSCTHDNQTPAAVSHHSNDQITMHIIQLLISKNK